MSHAFQTDDARLHPIAEKVLAGGRLSHDDALTLSRTGDILAVGWLANHVRERMHSDKTYFNVNRHINPTNVCVAACRLCAFGRKKDTPGAYTMALEEAFQTAASGYTEAVTEFHIVGGLHPDPPASIHFRAVAQKFFRIACAISSVITKLMVINGWRRRNWLTRSA